MGLESKKQISLHSATASFPILTGQNRSFRRHILSTASGGKFARGESGLVEVKAVGPVTGIISEGERVGIMGSNGAGKSTLLRLLSGVFRPTSGSVEIKGKVSTLIDIALGINPEASGIQNVFLRAAFMGISRKSTLGALDKIIDFAELRGFENLPVRTYSSGMQLRLAFAVSTMLSPEILIMDEWLSVGDQDFKARAERRLLEIVESSEIFVLASHDRKLLESSCTRGIVLEDGEAVFDGPIGEASNRYFGP